MAAFNEQLFEKRLLNLKDTQDSISGLSLWCLQHPLHHKKIVQVWLQVLRKVKIEQRLTLFYLANDVIQYSKRKGYDFVESWGTALQRATTMVRGEDKVRTKVLRLFTIWNERNIYDESFLVDLVGLLSSRTPAQTSVPDAQDFQPSILITKIRSCKTLEDETDHRLKIVNDSPLCLSDADVLRSSLKDRRHGEDVVAEVEDGIDKMEAYIKAIEVEIKERQELVELLDFADVFYETQRGEARIVCNAYRNFGARVKSLKKKLDELIPTLASPIPSPDINAPSPSPGSDIDLPDEHDLGSMGMTSFIGTTVIPDAMNNSMDSSDPNEAIHHSGLDQDILNEPVHHSNSRNLEEVPIQSSDDEPSTHHPLMQPQNSVALTHHQIPSPHHSVLPPQMSVPPPTLSIPPPQHPHAPPSQHPHVPPSQHQHVPPSQHPHPPPSQHPHAPPSQHQLVPPPPLPPMHSIPLLTHLPPPPPPPPPRPSHFMSPPPSFNQMPFPPLLEDGRDFPLNGGESFPNQNTDNQTSSLPFLGTDLSFIGNSDFQFDFQKNDFLRDDKNEAEDMPLSPMLEGLAENSISIDAAVNNSKEGKPIEVLSSTKNEPSFNLADFLKSLMTRDGSHMTRALSKDHIQHPVNTPRVDSAVPPPTEQPFPAKQWNSTLPPKFPSWSDSQPSWGEGMNSPSYKEGFGNSLDYEGPVGEGSPEDIDLPVAGSAVDIDHRNLISLTGSPLNNENQWRPLGREFRKRAADNRDIVESVDMEMSDDEEQSMQGGLMSMKLKPPPPALLTQHHKMQLNRKFSKREDTRTTLETLTGAGLNQSISFNISASNKLLAESPLKEKEEPKIKLHKLNSPPRNLLNVRNTMPPPAASPAAVKQSLMDVVVSEDTQKTVNPESGRNDSVTLESVLNDLKGNADDFKNSERNKVCGNEDIEHSTCNDKSNLLSFSSVDSNKSIGSQSKDVDERVESSGVSKDNNCSAKEDGGQSEGPPWNQFQPNPIGLPRLQSPPPSLMSQNAGFRMRQMRPQTPWRGPRRGMPNRFRSPGPNNGQNQLGNFQSPHMNPRPLFRGMNNNWRPRHW